jgi:hypothetical protein
MLSAIFSAVGGQIVDSLLGKITGLFESYFKKEISIEELRTRLSQSLLETFAEVEKAQADALAKTYASFMDALQKSKLMQCVWASVVLSQLFVLFWYQWIVPALVTWKFVTHYASAGATVEWAYLLLAACLGMGPVVLRSGPAAGNLAGTLKSMVGR